MLLLADQQVAVRPPGRLTAADADLSLGAPADVDVEGAARARDPPRALGARGRNRALSRHDGQEPASARPKKRVLNLGDEAEPWQAFVETYLAH